MSGFASSVLLGDLNDFIAPSQSCVNPIFAKPAKDGAAGEELGMPKIGLAIENDMDVGMSVEAFQAPPDLIKTSEQKTAKVSLSDCLACSGCVTSAETVLIEQQSRSEFERVAASGENDLVIVTLSTQSRASLAVHFKMEVPDLTSRLEAVLKSKGVDFVLDASVAGDIALLETANEFLFRYKNDSKENKLWETPTYSASVNSKSMELNPNKPNMSLVQHDGKVERKAKMPMLSSACPGWICFAEKSNPEVLPYISTVKSPQQIAGSLVKWYVSKLTGVPVNRIYHTTIMPCADKKLEASRRDFLDAETGTNDVDCVLTTIEACEMVEDYVADGDSEMMDTLQRNVKIPHQLEALNRVSMEGSQVIGASPSGGGSGGYLDFVYRVAARELFNISVPDGSLDWKVGRNADIHTVDLVVGDKTVLKFAAAYGFRNIQQIVRQIKRGKCPYDFVEIMACPGGCLNGGGQIRAEQPGVKQSNALLGKKRLEELEVVFRQRRVRYPQDNSVVHHLYREWINGDPYSDVARSILHTHLHAVPKLENGLLQKW